MKKLRISAICTNTTPLDFAGNLKTIQESLEDTRALESDIVVLPELALSGYGCEDAFYRNATSIKAWNSLTAILPYSETRTILVGLPVFQSPFLYNCIAVLDKEKIKCLVPKINLANTGIHYEKRWFHGSNSLFQTQFLSPTEEWIHFGHYILEKSGFLFGVEICEDSWSMNRPSQEYSQEGIDILFSPGASHFAMGKRERRLTLFSESSRNQGNLQVFTNLLGNEAGRVIYDGGAFFAQNGKIVKEGERLSFQKYTITNYELGLEEIRSQRSREFRETHPKRPNQRNIPTLSLHPIHPVKFKSLAILDHRTSAKTPEVSFDQNSPFIEFTRAVALGLWDYVRKSGTKGFTLSLSGGADSAVCAILTKLSLQFAIETLGKDSISRLGLDPDKYLVTLYQETENNSPLTKKIAATLSKELGVEHHEIQIDSQVQGAVALVQEKLGRTLSWKTDDLALQNIQARIRSPLVWLLANLNNHLLISTGNRSEASVGYTTMDGDASGSLCPIASVSKEFILEWIQHIQKGENPYQPPLESLNMLLSTKPTAELKPLSEKQEDEKDLMPYPILQFIERQIVFLGIDEHTCLERLGEAFPNFSKDSLSSFVEKFRKLFRISQWKRERLAPSFFLDEYALDPKTSYRYPILSGEG